MDIDGLRGTRLHARLSRMGYGWRVSGSGHAPCRASNAVGSALALDGTAATHLGFVISRVVSPFLWIAIVDTRGGLEWPHEESPLECAAPQQILGRHIEGELLQGA